MTLFRTISGRMAIHGMCVLCACYKEDHRRAAE